MHTLRLEREGTWGSLVNLRESQANRLINCLVSHSGIANPPPHPTPSTKVLESLWFDTEKGRDAQTVTAGIRIFWLLSRWKKKVNLLFRVCCLGLEHCVYWLGEVMAEEWGEWEGGQWEKGEDSPEMTVPRQLSSSHIQGPVCIWNRTWGSLESLMLVRTEKRWKLWSWFSKLWATILQSFPSLFVHLESGCCCQ